jgi:hypothetical protein
MYPIYIPSIYRPNSEFLIKLRDLKLKYYIILASHQYKSYLINFPSKNLIILPDNIIKISEIRQYILDVARKNKEDKIWMSDDDLTKFYIRKRINKNKDTNTKKETISSSLIPVDFKTFITRAEEIIKKISRIEPSLVQFGFKYSTFALPQKSITINTNIGMIQLLDIKKTNTINYDTSFITLEDTDFTIQLFKNNLNNCQLNDFIFIAPRSGQGKGGLENDYLSGAKQKGMLLFKKKYPELITINNLEKGKYLIKWSSFKKPEIEKNIIF